MGLFAENFDKRGMKFLKMTTVTFLLISAFIAYAKTEVIEDDVVIIVCDSDQDSLVKLAVKDKVIEEVRTAPAGSPTAIDYDSVEEQFYFIQYSPSLIKRADINGENVKTVFSLPGSSYSLAIDEDSRRLFYAGYSNNDIVSMDLTGSNPVKIHDSQTVNSPDQIVVHEIQRRIIWSDGKDGAKISSSKYDGSDIKKIADTSEISYGLTLDKGSEILYWTERSPGVIQSISLDGSNRTEIYRAESIYLYDIFLHGNYLYFTGKKLRVHRISVDGGVAQEISSTKAFGYPWGLYVYSQILYDEDPKLKSRLIHTDDLHSELLFLCTFSEHYLDVFYSTSWFVNDKLVLRSDPEKWFKGNVIENQALTETHLREANITAYGIQIACSVKAAFEERNNSTTAVRSKKKFVGIRVSRTSVRLSEGESTDIKLSLTDPFGCGRSSSECSLWVKVHTLHNSHLCDQAVMIPSECGASFKSTKWNESVSISLFGKMTSMYGFSSKEVSLNLTSTTDSNHHMWGKALLSQIQVQLAKDTSHIKEKSCHSNNDPHLKTFDGRHYEHQYSGTFTFYTHKDLPIEVQIQTAQCLNSPRAWCNCGVSVRAGKTVFEINRCPGQSDTWFMGYSLCEDGGDVLQVKRRGGDYDIYLPTGGKVVVNAHGSFLNLQMYPSVQDTEKSAGLCGRMSENGACDDDFVLRDGSYSTDPSATEGCNAKIKGLVNELKEFSNSWRVKNQTNLFNHSDLSSLSSWPQQRTFCSCSSDNTSFNLVTKLECSPGKAYEICKSLPGYSDVTPSNCSFNSRRRRSVREYKELEASFHHVYKRDTNTWLGNWTEDAATEHCEQLFQESKSIQICQNITGGETNSSIDDCILDIKLTGTTDFGKYSVDSVRSKCYHEVLVNPVLQDNGTSSSGNQSVYDIVVAEACPSDCSSNGNCSGGTCYCLPNFGGLDCSVDLSAPPVLSSKHDSHCDSSSLSCDFISVYGETFTEESTCLVEAFKVRDTGPELEWSRVSNASVQSISHVECNISVSKELGDTDYVRAFWISVSNDGTLYSNNVSVLVYDGSCVTGNINGTDISWTKQDSFCFYGERCYMNGETRIDDDCKVCIVNGSSTSWEKCTDSTTEASREPTTKATTQPTTETTTHLTTEPTTGASPQSTTEATTLPTTEPTTGTPTQPTTIATAQPTIKAATQPTIEATSLPRTEPTTKATTQTTTETTTHTTTVPTTGTPTKPTTIATAQPPTEATTLPTPEPTTKATNQSTTLATAQPTTGETTLPTTQLTTKATTQSTAKSISKAAVESPTDGTTVLTTELSTEATTEDSSTWTREDDTLTTKLPVSDRSKMDFNTVTALSVAGGIVAFAVIVAVITFITIKVGKLNKQMKESRLENAVSADQDPSWRQEETWTPNHSSILDNTQMPGRWSVGGKFLPTSYMKRPQFGNI